jgi:hypothetical protein
MCEDCVKLAEGILDVTGYPYRRALTQVELEHGDVDRVREDIDAAEQRVAKAGAPLVRKMVAQLYDEMRPLVESGDVAGIARVRASHTAELAAALKVAVNANVKAGKQQVRDSAKKAGVKLAAKPPGKDVKKALPYILAKSDAISEQVAAQIEATVRFQALKAARAAEYLEDDFDAGARALVASATSLGRESYAVGRVFGYDEVKQDIAEVVYTAILDDKVCDVCLEADGTTYTEDDIDAGFDSAPNDGCLGGDYCRCYPVLIYK